MPFISAVQLTKDPKSHSFQINKSTGNVQQLLVDKCVGDVLLRQTEFDTAIWWIYSLWFLSQPCQLCIHNGSGQCLPPPGGRSVHPYKWHQSWAVSAVFTVTGGEWANAHSAAEKRNAGEFNAVVPNLLDRLFFIGQKINWGSHQISNGAPARDKKKSLVRQTCVLNAVSIWRGQIHLSLNVLINTGRFESDIVKVFLWIHVSRGRQTADTFSQC